MIRKAEEESMATFFLFGKYSAASLKEISARRSEAAAATVKKLGGELKSMHALLGEQDLVLIVELPGIAEAVKCSLSLARQSGISFTTAPAIPVEQFDKLAAEI
jgi:uncharacterized protein with GYD domain